MANVYITFGGKAYDNQTRLIVERARDFGADQVRIYDDAWLLKTEFYQQNRWIFERQPQMGFGWCSWKPYILMCELNHRHPGDVVLYTDADTYPIADLRPIFDHARQFGVMLFEEQGCIHRQWTRRDCFNAIGLAPVAQHLDTVMACGRFSLWTPDAARWWQKFLEAWLRFSLDRRCQFHDVDKATEPDVIRHSAEQSVLGVLALWYKIPLHRTPDQNGWPVAHDGAYKPEDTYPQLFIQDGNRGDLRDVSGSRYRNI